jgi:hypothetical protein
MIYQGRVTLDLVMICVLLLVTGHGLDAQYRILEPLPERNVVKPFIARQVGSLARPEILESSGAAASQTQPGVFWTFNDSGGAAVVYAFDLGGRDLGAFRLLGATNVDWEAISVAPCDIGSGSPRAQAADTVPACLIIADVGDNRATRSSVVLYVVREPQIDVAVGIGATQSIETLRVLRLFYASGPQDVEAVYVSRDGTLHLVSKVGQRLRVTVEEWTQRRLVEAKDAGALPFEADVMSWRVITDAALAPNGSYLAVRTYSQVHLFAVVAETGEVRGDVKPVICDIAALREYQGEGITWHPSGFGLVLTSEGPAGQISFVACPLPHGVAVSPPQ